MEGVHVHNGGIADYPAGTSFGPRTLRDHEFVWIIAGEVVWRWGDTVRPLVPGDCLLARPGMRDAFDWDPHRTTRHGFVHCEVGPDALAVLPPVSAWPLVQRADEGSVLPALLHHVLHLRSREDGRAQADRALGLAVEAFVHRRHGVWASQAGESFHPRIERLLEHLAVRWRSGRLDAPGSDELAAVAGITRAHLGRLCRAEFGCTPQELLRGLRLDRAVLLLARTELKVATIAERCGFACPYHFSRCFRARAGCAPRAYRARLRAGGERGLPTPNRVRRVAQRIWER